MKEITCPYTWDCGKKSQSKKLSRHDYDFLQAAVKKKMTFMFIYCPSCSREFQFNAVQWKSTPASIYVNPGLKITSKNKQTTNTLIAILKKATIDIPVPYLDYLSSKAFNPGLSIFRGEHDFTLYTLDELCEKISVDGNPYLMISQLKGFANTLKKIPGKLLIKTKTQHFTWEELASCLVIGYENTRVLFIDCRDNNSLWIFHPDGGDVEKTTMTLKKIVARKK